MTDVLVVYFQEFITVKILKFFGKIPTGTDTSVRTDPKPKHFNAEELQELEKAVREAALYLLNAANKKSVPLEGDYCVRKKAEKTNQAQTGVSTDKEDKPGRRKKKVKNDPFTSTTDHLNDISTSRTKNISNEDEGMNQLEDTTVVVPRKKAEKKKSKAKNERNVDTNNSTSSRSFLPVLSDADFRSFNLYITVVAPQKKAAKKKRKAKNQRKQATSESTTSNSNTDVGESSDGSNMGITSASLPRFNQSPRFDNRSDNHDPNSIPMWFWYLCSLILLSNSNPSILQVINFTDSSHNTYTDNSRKSSQRIKGKARSRNYNSMDVMRTSHSTKIGEIAYEIQNGDSSDLDLE